MTMRVLVADSLSPEGLAILKAAPEISLTDRAGIERAELLELIGGFDTLVVRSRTMVDEEVFAHGKALRLVGRAGIGVDNVDLHAATRAGVVVMNTPEGNATTTAEHTLSLMMSLARWIPQASASMKRGLWEKKAFMGRELRGKTLGVIGLGNIGRLVAERALALQMRVLGYDPYYDANALAQLDVRQVELDELLAASDIITVHVPLNQQTENLLGDAELARTKRGVMLINCARGGIYSEESLLRGLQSGHVAGVALDVFVKEPPERDDPLVAHERVICTPHLGASTAEAQILVSIGIAEQIVEVAQGRPHKNAVNLPRMSEGQMRVLGPYLDLCTRMGSFCSQMAPGAVRAIRVEVAGLLAEHPSAPLVASAVAGTLQSQFTQPVTAVNALLLAQERGVEVLEQRSQKSARAYASSVCVTVTTTEQHQVVGTIFGARFEEGRIVEVDGVSLECIPDGAMLLVRNDDRPGVIGHLGSVLGRAGVNISRMHLGLDRATGKALSVINVDQVVPKSVLSALAVGPVEAVQYLFV